MIKKSFFIILGLSVVVTYGIAIIDFVFNISIGHIGLPLGFSSFNFMGSDTNYASLVLDIVFWFMIIWLIQKFLFKSFRK